MDTSEQRAIETVTHVKRRRRSVEEKRRIVEETLGAGASVARVAQLCLQAVDFATVTNASKPFLTLPH
jgi:hypothetical protein